MGDRKVFYDEEGLVEKAKVEAHGAEGHVWVTKNGKIFQTEHMARYSACTHTKCDSDDCENYTRKGFVTCKTCRKENRQEKYDGFPEEPWEEESLITIYHGDRFFEYWDAVIDFAVDIQKSPDELWLIHTQPVGFRRLDADEFLHDCLPRDMGPGALDPEIYEAAKEFNEAVEEHHPFAFTSKKVAVEVPEGVVNEYQRRLEKAMGI